MGVCNNTKRPYKTKNSNSNDISIRSKETDYNATVNSSQFNEKKIDNNIIVNSNQLNEKKIDNKLEISEHYKIIEKILEKHNKFRETNNLNKLKLNPDLCELAQRYAEKCADQESIDLCPFLYKDNIIGENIEEFVNDIFEICDKWFQEQIHLNPDNNGVGKKYKNISKHVLQILDNNTKEVGFGFSTSPNRKSYFVAYYYPASNLI